MAIQTRSAPADESEVSPWAGKRMSLEEFLALPDDAPHLEYDDGLVTQKMSPKPTHGAIQYFFAEALNRVARPARLGIALPETRFVTARWVPTPDVAFYRRERLPKRHLPDEFREPPDLAIEIASPGQKWVDLMRKCLRYLAQGTSAAVLVDPEQEAVLLFRPDQPLRVLQGDDRIDLDDVLPGFELTVRQLFEALSLGWLDEESEGPSEPTAPAEAGAAAEVDAPGGAGQAAGASEHPAGEATAPSPEPPLAEERPA